MKKLFKNLFIFIAVFIGIAILFSFTESGSGEAEKISMSTFISQVNEGKIESIVVDGEDLKITLNDEEETKEIVKKEPGATLSEILKNFDVDKEKVAGLDIEIKDNTQKDIFFGLIFPVLLPILLIGGLIFFMMRGVQGANSKAMMFGQSGAKEFGKDEKNKVTFKDVAGVKEAKEELKEVVEFLKQPKKFLDLGARIPRGVLLLGGPGTGKTLMARAVAGEADVPFFHISGSEFVEMFVGVGASRVRDLFKKAKKNAPCIVFIDEIDAVGRRRGAGLGGSHDEREQTLNQILVEMDGFEPHVNVIVIAATNRPDVLDPALLRPGRFDRQVVLDNPDIADREAILKIHSKQKPLSKEVSIRKIAERTPGFSGADLFNLLNEGAILAARQNKKIIDMEDLLEAIEKVMLGPERKSKVFSDHEKKVTAYHEAGHAVVAHFLPNVDPVQKISIISRGRAAGYMLKLPTADKHMHTKSEYLEDMSVLLAGFLTEKEVFGELTTGATSDLRKTTDLAKKLVTSFGMSDNLGPRTFGEKEEMIFLGKEIHEQKDYSEKTAELIDKEVSCFISGAAKKAKEIIIDKRDVLEKVAQTLLKKETLEREEFEEIVGKKIEK
ncbi:ATP-dependent zinc metalloprotease FtsH [Candidatus Parcubacteria bacterium]|nr:ATP-dependent zinc metalloprotease FtsH [Candidatus Parcubacteria bacterium]